MNRGRYGYRDGRYRGFTGTDSTNIPTMVLFFVLGIGLPFLLWFSLLERPILWTMLIMTGALLMGGGMCWVCRRLDWPLLSSFEFFTSILLMLWHITLRLKVTERVVLQNGGHLLLIGAAVGVFAAVRTFRWEKRRRERVSLVFALVIGALCFSFCHGTLLGVNILADGYTPRQAGAQVLRLEREQRTMYAVGGPQNYTVYFAVVEENDLTSGGWVPIEKAAYDNLCPGDEVALILHPGALGAAWIECMPLTQ